MLFGNPTIADRDDHETIPVQVAVDVQNELSWDVLAFAHGRALCVQIKEVVRFDEVHGFVLEKALQVALLCEHASDHLNFLCRLLDSTRAGAASHLAKTSAPRTGRWGCNGKGPEAQSG